MLSEEPLTTSPLHQLGGVPRNTTRLHVPQKLWFLMGLEASEVTTSSYEHSGSPGAFHIYRDITCYDPSLELEYVLWIVSPSPSLPGMWFKYTRLPNAKGDQQHGVHLLHPSGQVLNPNTSGLEVQTAEKPSFPGG